MLLCVVARGQYIHQMDLILPGEPWIKLEHASSQVTLSYELNNSSQ